MGRPIENFHKLGEFHLPPLFVHFLFVKMVCAPLAVQLSKPQTRNGKTSSSAFFGTKHDQRKRWGGGGAKRCKKILV